MKQAVIIAVAIVLGFGILSLVVAAGRDDPAPARPVLPFLLPPPSYLLDPSYGIDNCENLGHRWNWTTHRCDILSRTSP
jgi:hypothetical protein